MIGKTSRSLLLRLITQSWPLLVAILPAAAVVNQPEALLQTFCLDCHSAAKQKGELDLESSDIHKEPHIWEHVLEQLESGEMPPKRETQPSAEERKQLIGWVRGTLDQIALSQAGDPGPVVLRRLSNMEYTYTLRDLTGIESLDPAREFPADGAAGEGFTNAGAALVMSPTLLVKYLDAAKEVAAHAVFTPYGLRWSPSVSAQDWQDEALRRIRQIYARHTATGQAAETVAQGIRLDKGTGSGRLPLAKYLDALQNRASADGLSPRYLQLLREALSSSQPSLLLDPLRAKYREHSLTVADIEPWQESLWRFANVGHIGKVNGPKAWQEPVTPLTPQHEMRVKLDSGLDVSLYLAVNDAGDGNEDDEVIWENPRIIVAGKPSVPVPSIPALIQHVESRRAALIASAEQCLNALAAKKEDGVDAAMLSAWRAYLGFFPSKLEPLLAKAGKGIANYDFIKGWQGENALGVLANSSPAEVRIPGLMKAHSVATHPSPERASVIAWRCVSPGVFRISGDVADAHTSCGNGVVWSVEVRRGGVSEVLARGETKDAALTNFGPFESVAIEAGQAVALVIGPKDGNHLCDLTAVNLTVSDGANTWDLAKDVAPDILQGNPHGPWHFLSQPASLEAAPDVPAPIAKWRRHPSPELAAKVREHLEKDLPLSSPLLRPFWTETPRQPEGPAAPNLKASAPSVIEVNIPAALAKGTEFVVTGKLVSKTAGSVQMRVLTQKPESLAPLIAGQAETALKPGTWSDHHLVTQHSVPVIVNDASEARSRFEAAFDEFRALFPIALAYERIVPVDEVVTLTLFHREDEALRRLMLSAVETQELDQAWEELIFVSQAPLKQVDAFEQIWQFATQDAKPEAFEPMREPILQAAAKFRERQIAAIEPQKAAVLAFAEKAWRRTLTESEIASLRRFDPRLMLVRVLASPAFLYRAEKALAVTGPVSREELATRLSYFLWSSAPDEALRLANLSDSATLAAETRRLLKNEKSVGLPPSLAANICTFAMSPCLMKKASVTFPVSRVFAATCRRR